MLINTQWKWIRWSWAPYWRSEVETTPTLNQLEMIRGSRTNQHSIAFFAICGIVCALEDNHNKCGPVAIRCFNTELWNLVSNACHSALSHNHPRWHWFECPFTFFTAWINYPNVALFTIAIQLQSDKQTFHLIFSATCCYLKRVLQYLDKDCIYSYFYLTSIMNLM